MRPVPTSLYPFAGHFLDVGGCRLHYVDEGDGPPVVMVHGNPTWSFYYRRLIAALPGHRRVVPDHIGCGRSDRPDEDRYRYTLARRVADLTALIDHLALGPLTLVVHDWGGMIGLAWAVRHLDQVERLVLLNTAAFPLPTGKPLPWQLRLVRDTPLGPFLVRGLNAFCRGAVQSAVTRRPLEPAVAAAYCAPYDSWAARLAVLRFVEDIPLAPGDAAWDVVTETAARLPLLADKPTLICWGAKDFVFDDAFLARWREILPQAAVHRFADCGHYVLEDAADEIVELVRAFLAGRGEGRA